MLVSTGPPCEIDSFAVCATICCIILLGEGTASVSPPTLDGANARITLANATHTNAVCISMAAPSDLFCSCLVGVPIGKKHFGKLYNESMQQSFMASSILQPRGWCQHTWQKTAVWDETWCKDLRRMCGFPALLSQPEELDTLGTLCPSLCFYTDDTFNFHMNSVNFDVSPKGMFSNASLWCNRTLESRLTSSISDIALPSCLLLIWREGIWKGTPAKLLADLAPLAS